MKRKNATLKMNAGYMIQRPALDPSLFQRGRLDPGSRF
jgi:hypothetical protein